MQREQKYRGKTIRVIVSVNEKGWLWAFRVDDGPVVTHGDPPVDTRTQAHANALKTARLEVDRLEDRSNAAPSPEGR